MKCLQTSYLLTALSTRLGDQGCCALEPDDWLKDWQWSNSYYLSGKFTLSELNTCALICFLSRCWQGRQKEGERVSRDWIEDPGVQKKNSIKWPKWVINSLVTSRTTFAASERGIQRKLKQKWLGKGGGRDHQSSALMILWAAAERGFLLSGRRRGRTSKSNRLGVHLSKQYQWVFRYWQWRRGEGGWLKKVEKILKKRWLSVAGGSRQRDEHILRGM